MISAVHNIQINSYNDKHDFCYGIEMLGFLFER